MAIPNYANFSNQFVQNALNPQPKPVGQTMTGFSPSNFSNEFVQRATRPAQAPTLSSSGGGGGGGGGQRPGGITPDGSWSVGYNGPGDGDAEAAAREQARIELESALSEYDRQAELGQNQISSLETEQTGTLSDIDTMRQRAMKEGTTSKTEAESATMKERGKALGTAQDTQKTNRNILRALGILSSSAAGEMLTKPMTEFGKISGELGTQLVKRKQQVDDWLAQRGEDFDRETLKIKNQYAGLINNIRTDLRYNGEQRALAVRAASAALTQKLGEIKQQAMQYQQAAREYNNNILSQIAQIQLYQNPNADVSSILSSMLDPGAQRPQGQTAAIVQDPRKKQTLSGY